MPELNEPDANGAAGTGANPPATQQPQTPAAVTPDSMQAPEGYVLLKDEDHKNLVSQRDKANNNNSNLQETVEDLQLNQALAAQESAVTKAVGATDFKEKYPDVTAEDILSGNPVNSEEIEEIAKKQQARFEQVAQAHLKRVQVADVPEITQSDRDAKLKELSGPNKPKNAFGQAIRLQMAKIKK